uniref:Uncharacterized protein n=1 Tax=Sus scrofa TaxID=9823 RepID=A0A8D0WAQ5_PIG
MATLFGTLGSSLGRSSLGQLGGSVASLTGHILNATKVVLGKGSERGPQDVPQSMKKEGTPNLSCFRGENSRKQQSEERKLPHDGCTCCQRSRPGQTSRGKYKTLHST